MRRPKTIDATISRSPTRHLVAGRTTTTIPKQFGAVQLVARTDDGKQLPLFGCAVDGCGRLYWSEEAAQKCCEKYPLCVQCGHKTGNLCNFQSDSYCAWCRDRREWRYWLRCREEVSATEQLSWGEDKYGYADDFWEAVGELAHATANGVESPDPWRLFYIAFESLRPFSVVLWMLSVPTLEEFSERLIDSDFVDCDWEAPDEISSAIGQAHKLLTAAAEKHPLGMIRGDTRPAGILEELADRAAEFVAEWSKQ
jgi:hypothetical protein